MSSTNLAGRAGRWSAAHWKTAAFGWIAIAVLAVVAGSAVGAKQMKSWAFANGDRVVLSRCSTMPTSAHRPARACSFSRGRRSRLDGVRRRGARRRPRAVRAGDVSRTSFSRPAAMRRARLQGPPLGARPVRRPRRPRRRERQDRADPGGRRRRAGSPTRASSSESSATRLPTAVSAIASHRDMHRAEYTSVPLTLAILVVAFGALVAAGLPVLLALSAVLAATGLNALASHLVPTDQQTLSAIILMLGMAVGIDYSLFYLRREREERHAGARAARRSAAHRAHLRSSRARLRCDGADRDGRDVRRAATRCSRRSASGR